MNVSAANALLKTFLRTRPRRVLFLVSHAPGGLIATIRSRCRRLAFPAWSEGRVTAFLQARTGVDAEAALRLARMSRCAPGRAVQMAEGGALDADGGGPRRSWTPPAGRLDDAALPGQYADSFRGAEGAEAVPSCCSTGCADQVHAMAAQAAEGEASAKKSTRWARAGVGESGRPAAPGRGR